MNTYEKIFISLKHVFGKYLKDIRSIIYWMFTFRIENNVTLIDILSQLIHKEIEKVVIEKKYI